jgi:MoaA/NifB/PqqE/SkfB family radical SAM enzyme
LSPAQETFSRLGHPACFDRLTRTHVRSKFKSVHLSIDSATPELHDEIRKRKGAFEKVVTAAKTYVQCGFPVWVNSSLNQKNKTEVKALVALAEELGAIGIQFAGTIPAAWNRHLVLSDKDSLALYQEITSLKENAKIKIETTSALYTKGGVYFCGLLSLYGLSVNANGEVTFCCDTQQENSAIGSLQEHSLSELIQKRLELSARIQKQRVEHIRTGNIGEHFDTCGFCNEYFVKDSYVSPPSVEGGGGGIVPLLSPPS